MKPFLKQIAELYIKNDSTELYKFCFIFPNRRSGIFFNKYLTECNSSNFILPEITTINDFINSVTDSVEASRIEMLFTLYSEYKNLSEEIDDFDQFIFWGDMLINDFNDVDKYMADAKLLFSNVKELKEISTSYLSKEQIEIINKFWGEERGIEPIEEFWKHLHEPNSDSTNKQKFLKLWNTLYPLYLNIRQNLLDRGLSYSGMSYRKAAEKFKKLTYSDLQYTRYIFIGFNVLSQAEESIFRSLQNLGVTDFYWDFNSPALTDIDNKASKFLNRYIKEYKSRYPIEEEKITTYPNIEIIPLPSNIAQTKYSAKIINELIDSRQITDTKNAINSAIVLPDEELFMPLIHSIPSSIESINVTMGYSMRYTSIAALISSVTSMRNRARMQNSETTYYHEDIKNILAIPLINKIAGANSSKIIDHIKRYRTLFLSAEVITGISPELNFIFSKLPVTSNHNSEIIDYLYEIIREVENYLIDNTNEESDNIELGFISQYKTSLNQLTATIKSYSTIQMKEKTLLQIMERLLSTATIAFEGEPLNGLQIMGVLETRSLDFDNIIMLSMNQKIFPRKHFAGSFIPNNLRKGFGLSTMDYQESVYAYYFYRLISRAKNLYLLYDSRAQGLKSGEESCYIYQLKHLYKPEHINERNTTFKLSTTDQTIISIPKTPEILAKLERYRTANSGKSFSASSINKYINCPLEFYFEKVEELYIEDEISELMDSGTFGSIIHEVMQQIYAKYTSCTITKDIIENIKKNRVYLEQITTKTINKLFHKHKTDKLLTPLSGESILIAKVAIYYIRLILDYDSNETPFIYESAELEEYLDFKISDDITINFKQYIDRVDIVKPKEPTELLRIVDYKTGVDMTEISSVEELFTANKAGDRAKAILQLMLYCNAYAQKHNYKADIKPVIYKLRNIKNIDKFEIKYKSDQGKSITLDSYKEINKQFMDNLAIRVGEIFDPEIPFTQAKSEKNCKFCKFKDFCRR
ncbi:MAG: PD-(D/E)XK nuclease family protein [Bacteroidales bacterium]